MEIFHRVGLSEAFRISHVIVAVMWMGLLWYFNFIQTPAFAEMEASSRNDAFDKLTWRALWWFRWSAAATVFIAVTGCVGSPCGKYESVTGTDVDPELKMRTSLFQWAIPMSKSPTPGSV